MQSVTPHKYFIIEAVTYVQTMCIKREITENDV